MSTGILEAPDLELIEIQQVNDRCEDGHEEVSVECSIEAVALAGYHCTPQILELVCRNLLEHIEYCRADGGRRCRQCHRSCRDCWFTVPI